MAVMPGTSNISNRRLSLPGLTMWLATLAGLGLSITALFQVCGSCSETANYLIFGRQFGWFGITFFALLTTAVALRQGYGTHWLVDLLAFAAAGAEIRFIWIQKVQIGQWCPICLAIAGTVLFVCVGAVWERIRYLNAKGKTMKSRFIYFALVALILVAGGGAAIAGVKKQPDIAQIDLFLGRQSSPTTVYFVSDWFCPACRKVEPVIERMYPKLARSVRIGFVDFPIHRETTNFTPFNIQFLAFEKGKYISLRRALSELSMKTRTPSESEVQAAVAPLGVRLRPMNYSDTLYGLQANLMIYRGFNVASTPTVVVTNEKTKKTRLLSGQNHITLEGVRTAIAEVGRL